MTSVSAISSAFENTALPDARDLFGHPRGLTVLFLTGMWEVFAIVGMRAVLIYYLVKQLHFSDGAAVQVYAVAAGACTLLGLVGGVLADRVLGIRRAVILGAVLMGVGSFFLVVETLLYPGLALMAMGNGLVKPTLVAQVGHLYQPGDDRRDRAFVIYKVGCNLGAVLAPLICGTIGMIYGWSWAFAASGVGMIFSIVVYVVGRGTLPPVPPAAARAQAPVTGNPGSAREILILLAIVWVGAAVFWTAYRQVESSIVLWVDSGVDRTLALGGWSFDIPATWFQAINPLLVFAYAPAINWLWAQQKTSPHVAPDLGKIILGSGLLTAAFVVLSAAASLTAGQNGVGAIWLVLAIALLTAAEMYVDPVGQAIFSRLAVRGMGSLFVSFWFLTFFASYAGTAILGGYWESMTPAGFFALVGVFAVLAGAIMYAARRFALLKVPA